MAGKERMGLRVKENTLRSDWDSNGALIEVRGAVWIDVTPQCILQPDLIEEIAELLAIEEAHETIERTIRINGWKVSRNGDRIEVAPQSCSEQGEADPVSRREFIDMVRPSEGWGR